MQRPHSPGSSKFCLPDLFDDSSEQLVLFREEPQEYEYHTQETFGQIFLPQKDYKYEVDKVIDDAKIGDISSLITQITVHSRVSEEEQERELARKRDQYVLQHQWDQNEFDMIYKEIKLSYSQREISEEQGHSLINKSSHQVSSSYNIQQSPLQTSQKTTKNDERKNVCWNSFRHIVKMFLSQKNQSFVKKVCKKHGVSNTNSAKQYIQMYYKSETSLKGIKGFLSFEADDPQSNIKLAFNTFYVWYMRRRYTIYILTQKQIINKDMYIETKNLLAYMPETKKRTFSPLEEGI